MIQCHCVVHSLYSNDACHFPHSAANLALSENSLTGTIPTEIGFLTKLSESSVAWFFLAMTMLVVVFSCTLMLACLSILLQLGCIFTLII